MADDIRASARRMVRVLRVQRIAAALALVLLATGGTEARAEEDDAISIGTELMATADVTLHKAEIARGSKVSVTKLNLREGKVDSINVALADGHVVKMPLVAVRSYFRVVAE
jgi:prepilin-type processing-associated H-X9-DG protein